ncbi:MAG: pentapeptide repeat-containing protein [Cyanobacteria bacterium P01_D01_bin.1]
MKSVTVKELIDRYKAEERDFRKLNLQGKSFRNQNFSGADFTGCDIRGCDFSDCDLSNTKFEQALIGPRYVGYRFAAIVLGVALYLSSIFGISIFLPHVLIIIIIFLYFSLAAVVTQLSPLHTFPSQETKSRIDRRYRDLSFVKKPWHVFRKTVPTLKKDTYSATRAYLIKHLVISDVLSIELIELLSVSTISLIPLAAIAITVIKSTTFINSNQHYLAIGSLVLLITVILIITAESTLNPLRDFSGWRRESSLRAKSGTLFKGSNLRDASFKDSKIVGAYFIEACLDRVCWQGIQIVGGYIVFNKEYIRQIEQNEEIGLMLLGQSPNNKQMSGLDLGNLYLSNLDLSEFDFSNSDLSGSTLCYTDLSSSNLKRTQLLDSNLSFANLTGACIEDWNINRSTNLSRISCQYIYLQEGNKERRPSDSFFGEDEFSKLFEKALATVDLVFMNGVDWEAFFGSFKRLQARYRTQNISVQAIERKNSGAFVIRLEVPEHLQKASIEEDAKRFYIKEVELVEKRYKDLLKLQGQQLKDYRKELQSSRNSNSRLLNIVETMAEKDSASKFDLRGASIGNLADSVQSGGRQQSIQHIHSHTEQHQSFAEAAEEIQQLLTQLEKSNPDATEAEQTAFLNAMVQPNRRQRFVSAFKATSSAALDEIPYGPVIKAAIDGWKNP